MDTILSLLYEFIIKDVSQIVLSYMIPYSLEYKQECKIDTSYITSVYYSDTPCHRKCSINKHISLTDEHNIHVFNDDLQLCYKIHLPFNIIASYICITDHYISVSERSIIYVLNISDYKSVREAEINNVVSYPCKKSCIGCNYFQRTRHNKLCIYDCNLKMKSEWNSVLYNYTIIRLHHYIRITMIFMYSTIIIYMYITTSQYNHTKK
jgi:hypothetical protein